MAVVKFAQYREYERARVEASNAMMALLAGAQLANHLLKLTEGSTQLLPDVYPNVPHIRRFHLTTDAATEILSSADTHLGAMGVPYALAIHENYMKTALGMLETAKLVQPRVAESTVSAAQHQVFARAANAKFDQQSASQLDVLRLMRNCLIHNGQRATQTLVKRVASWPASIEQSWVGVAHRSPRGLREGDPITFSHGEMTLALAVTKSLDRQANEMLQRALPRAVWADIMIADLLTMDPSVRKRSDRDRKALGVARHYYRPLSLTATELAAAFARL